MGLPSSLKHLDRPQRQLITAHWFGQQQHFGEPGVAVDLVLHDDAGIVRIGQHEHAHPRQLWGSQPFQDFQPPSIARQAQYNQGRSHGRQRGHRGGAGIDHVGGQPNGEAEMLQSEPAPEDLFTRTPSIFVAEEILIHNIRLYLDCGSGRDCQFDGWIVIEIQCELAGGSWHRKANEKLAINVCLPYEVAF
jgi:hypothetical protein